MTDAKDYGAWLGSKEAGEAFLSFYEMARGVAHAEARDDPELAGRMLALLGVVAVGVLAKNHRQWTLELIESRVRYGIFPEWLLGR